MNPSRFFSRRLKLALAATLVCVGAHTVWAQTTIGVNFTAGSQTVSAPDQPGLIAGANWNNLDGSSGTSISLVDNSNGTTTAQITFSSAGSFAGYSALSTSNAATNKLYEGGIGGSTVGGEVSITISGIPYAQYDVYVFASADTSNTTTLSLTGFGTTIFYRSGGANNSGATSLLEATSTNSGSPTTGQATYVRFSSQSGSSFNLLTGGSISGQISNNVFGLQIVAVPEPATVTLLMGLGALGVGLIARRLRRARRSEVAPPQ